MGHQLQPRSQASLNGIKCSGVWMDDGLTWKRQVEAVRKNCFCGHAKLRRLWDVLPPMAKRCIVLQCYLTWTTVPKSAQNWNRWPKRDTVCLIKDVKSQLDKFCSVVGLFFGRIQFLIVLNLYVMQDCGSHVDQLSSIPTPPWLPKLVCHAGLWLPCRSAVQADGKLPVENQNHQSKCDRLCSIPYLAWTET